MMYILSMGAVILVWFSPDSGSIYQECLQKGSSGVSLFGFTPGAN